MTINKTLFADLWKTPVITITGLVAGIATLYCVSKNSFAGWALTQGDLTREPWTLLTAVFPHMGLVHLAFNGYWLIALGHRIERHYGSIRAIGIIVLLAVLSSAAEHALSAPGVGLSGVVYGLMTFAWVSRERVPDLQAVATPKTAGLFVAWFFVCIATTWVGIMPVGNAAHAGGALAGWLLGRATVSRPARIAWVGALSVFGVAAVVFATVAYPLANLHHRFASGEFAAARAAQQGDWNQAIKILEPIADGPSPTPSSLANLGIAYQRLHRYDDAVVMYRRAMSADPSLRSHLGPTVVSILNQQVYAALNRKDLEEARVKNEEALQLDPDNTYGKMIRAMMTKPETDDAGQKAPPSSSP